MSDRTDANGASNGPRPSLSAAGAWPRLTTGSENILHAYTNSVTKPMLAQITKSLNPPISKAFFPEVSKALFPDMPKLMFSQGAWPRLSASIQGILQAHMDSVTKPVLAEITKSLDLAMPKALFPDVPKVMFSQGAWPRLSASITVPAGQTARERVLFSGLLGQSSEIRAAGTDGQATLDDLARLQAERRAAAYLADQAILELRDELEQLVAIIQAAHRHQEAEDRFSRRLQFAILVATLVLGLLPYLFPPRSGPTPSPHPSVTAPGGPGSTTITTTATRSTRPSQRPGPARHGRTP